MQLRLITKQAMGAVGAATALLQIPQVTDTLKSAVVHHPHMSTSLGALITIAALLHNPQVIQALGLKTKTQEVEVVPLGTPQQPPTA